MCVPRVIPKAVETGVSAKEVMQKVKVEVRPTLGVRVHDLFAMRDGGAVIRTPSVAEREKVAANANFGEVWFSEGSCKNFGGRIFD